MEIESLNKNIRGMEEDMDLNSTPAWSVDKSAYDSKKYMQPIEDASLLERKQSDDEDGFTKLLNLSQ